MNMKKNKIVAVLAASVAAVATTGANAAIDVSSVTASIGEAAAPIAAIGGAVLVVIVGSRLWKWIRAAL